MHLFGEVNEGVQDFDGGDLLSVCIGIYKATEVATTNMEFVCSDRFSGFLDQGGSTSDGNLFLERD